jgi:hypothetical protein
MARTPSRSMASHAGRVRSNSSRSSCNVVHCTGFSMAVTVAAQDLESIDVSEQVDADGVSADGALQFRTTQDGGNFLWFAPQWISSGESLSNEVYLGGGDAHGQFGV